MLGRKCNLKFFADCFWCASGGRFAGSCECEPACDTIFVQWKIAYIKIGNIDTVAAWSILPIEISIFHIFFKKLLTIGLIFDSLLTPVNIFFWNLWKLKKSFSIYNSPILDWRRRGTKHEILTKVHFHVFPFLILICRIFYQSEQKKKQQHMMLLKYNNKSIKNINQINGFIQKIDDFFQFDFVFHFIPKSHKLSVYCIMNLIRNWKSSFSIYAVDTGVWN